MRDGIANCDVMIIESDNLTKKNDMANAILIKRTTLIVRDMNASSQWYEEVLGMTLYYDDEVILSGNGMAAGKKGDVTHLKIYKCEDPVIGMIGLLQWVDPIMPAPEIPKL